MSHTSRPPTYTISPTTPHTPHITPRTSSSPSTPHTTPPTHPTQPTRRPSHATRNACPILTPSGDPDLYVGVGPDFPTRDDFVWRSSTSTDDQVRVPPCERTPNIADDGGEDEPSYSGCLYYISVYAWSPNVEFSIAVTPVGSERLLRDGQVVNSHVLRGESRLFRYLVRGVEDIEAVLTPFSGDASLYGRFMSKPEPSHLNSSVQWASTEARGVEALVASHTDPRFCEGTPLVLP